MTIEEIKVTPEHFDGPYYNSCREIHPQYVSPGGYIWKVSKVEDSGIHVWNINGWGRFYTDVIPVHVFLHDWKRSK